VAGSGGGRKGKKSRSWLSEKKKRFLFGKKKKRVAQEGKTAISFPVREEESRRPSGEKNKKQKKDSVLLSKGGRILPRGTQKTVKASKSVRVGVGAK